MKKRKIKKGALILGIVLILIVGLICFLKPSNNKLLGTWESTGGTIYEFQTKNKGVMKTSISEYEFTYETKKNKMSIDFKDEKVTDADYEYELGKDQLTLKGDRGTFTFKRK